MHCAVTLECATLDQHTVWTGLCVQVVRELWLHYVSVVHTETDYGTTG